MNFRDTVHEINLANYCVCLSNAIMYMKSHGKLSCCLYELKMKLKNENVEIC